MDSSDFSVLVGRLERQSDEAPRLYAARVALVAALGYAPVGSAVAVMLVGAYFCVTSIVAGADVSQFSIIGILSGAGMAFAVARTSIAKIDPPEGRPMTPEEAPELFAAIDDVLQRTAAQRNRKGKPNGAALARVTLDAEFSASLRQIPRWGVFGAYSNHLRLGIPLLAALNIAELKTLLAHEIGHLGGDQSKFAAWIYRQRAAWQALQRKFAEPKGLFEQLLAVFYRWYAPYFNAYTFVLARNHEYHADQVAAWATDARVLGRALVKVDLAERFLTEIFWERFYAQVEKVPEPPYLPYSMLPRALSIAHKEWLRADWLQASLRRFASEADTHPGLRERLTALNVPAEVPTHMADKTALTLLGAMALALLKWCDEEWRAENASAWRKRHDGMREARWKIAQYENTPAAELKPADLWEKTLLLLDVGHEPAAVEELRALVILDSSFAKAHFLLGRLLLESGDETGLQSLALAAQQDEEFLASAGQLGYGYLMDRGRKGEAQRFWDRCRVAA